MRSSKHLFIGLLSVVFVGGTVGVGLAPDSQAGFFDKQAFPQAPFVQKWFQKTVCGFRNPGERFVTSKDGKEVRDRTTGNIWEHHPASPSRDWNGAKEYGAELNKGLGKAYKLPTIQQLASVLNYLEKSPALTPGVFLGVQRVFYWSATEVAGNPLRAWFLNPSKGNVPTPIRATATACGVCAVARMPMRIGDLII